MQYHNANTFKLLIIKLIQLCILTSFSKINVIEVKVITPEIRTIFNAQNAIGVVQTTQKKDFVATVSGTIDFIHTPEAGYVKKGQVLFIINQELAQSIKNQAQTNYNQTLLSLKRNQKLYAAEYISLQDLENTITQAHNAKLELEKANVLYNNMVILAPFDGIIGPTNYTTGQYIYANPSSPETLFSIIATDVPQIVSFYLAEDLIDKIQIDQQVDIQYQNKNYTAKVISKANYLNKTNASFLVKTQIQQKSDIPDATFVTATFLFDQHDAITIPEEAIIKTANGSIIYVIEHNKAKAIPIQIATRSAGFIEIISEQITPDSIIVSQGLMKIYDGAEVRIVN